MPHLERSVLSVPGSYWHMIEKAVTTEADLAFIDLEDAVAPNVKVESRQNGVPTFFPPKIPANQA